MEKYKPLFLALAVAVLFVPLALYVRKFTEIDRPLRYSVSFNPTECYACRGCPCEISLNDGKDYVLNRYDKSVCKIDYREINRGMREGLTNMSVEMSIPEYREFSDCLKWYSEHPSTYGVKLK